MTAVPQKAAVLLRVANGRVGPGPDIRQLFDHPVGGHEQDLAARSGPRLGGLDRAQLVLRACLPGQPRGALIGDA
jgi:hypothetical protein